VRVVQEEQPCRWFNSELFPLISHAVRGLAKFIGKEDHALLHFVEPRISFNDTRHDTTHTAHATRHDTHEGAKPHEVVFARNATTAINAILRSFPFQSGDALLCMNFTYGAIKKTLQYVLPRQKVDIVEVQIDSHPTGQQVTHTHSTHTPHRTRHIAHGSRCVCVPVAGGRQDQGGAGERQGEEDPGGAARPHHLPAGHGPPHGNPHFASDSAFDRLACHLLVCVVGVVCRVVGVVCRVVCVVAQKELVELIHAHGARVLVDGAHAVGQVPLNLHELNADYFVSNCHKWLYAPRGCAFAWCASHDTTNDTTRATTRTLRGLVFADPSACCCIG
jgi:hypothetical protein